MTVVYLGKKYFTRANIGVIVHCLENRQQGVETWENRHLQIARLAVVVISSLIDSYTPKRTKKVAKPNRWPHLFQANYGKEIGPA